MIHRHVGTDPTSGEHWAVGRSGHTATGETRVLAQISNAKGDQVRIALPLDEATTLSQALDLIAGARNGTTIRGLCGPENDSRAWSIYAIDSGRVRVDFSWAKEFTAIVMSPAEAKSFALELRIVVDTRKP